MNRYFLGLLTIALVLFLNGCETVPGPPPHVTAGQLKPPTTRSFLLSRPYVIPPTEGLTEIELTLPPGRYSSHYRDEGGEYFEAPFSSRKEYAFTGGRGGIYISNETPSLARFYFQDLSTLVIPAYYATLVVGPSGRMARSTPLPSSFLSRIKISS